jgi:hypothetical protein
MLMPKMMMMMMQRLLIARRLPSLMFEFGHEVHLRCIYHNLCMRWDCDA